jgi:hypothetical protein
MGRENSLTLLWHEWGSNPIPSDCATGPGEEEEEEEEGEGEGEEETTTKTTTITNKIPN